MKKVVCILVALFLLGCVSSNEIIPSDVHYVENPPQFKGGEVAMNEYIMDEILKSPKDFFGKVCIIVTISSKGEINSPLIYKSTVEIDKIKKRAIEIVKNMPLFSPATLQGNPISCRYSIIIDFDKYKK